MDDALPTFRTWMLSCTFRTWMALHICSDLRDLVVRSCGGRRHWISPVAPSLNPPCRVRDNIYLDLISSLLFLQMKGFLHAWILAPQNDEHCNCWISNCDHSLCCCAPYCTIRKGDGAALGLRSYSEHKFAGSFTCIIPSWLMIEIDCQLTCRAMLNDVIHPSDTAG